MIDHTIHKLLLNCVLWIEGSIELALKTLTLAGILKGENLSFGITAVLYGI